MQEYEIEFYDKADGSEPVKEFILSLDKKMQAKVLRTVALLREEGPCLREPYSKALDDGIFEIRTKFGSDITRVLYFFVVGKKVILTNGFIKKTQKHLLQRSHWQNNIAQIILPERRIPNDKLQRFFE